MQEMRVQSLGQEDPLKKGMSTHSNILAWGIPWTEEPGGLQCMGHKEQDTTEATLHACTQIPFYDAQFSGFRNKHGQLYILQEFKTA